MRSSPREAALRILYESDQRCQDVEAGSGRTGRIVAGVRTERDLLDQALAEVSTNWRVERMPPVDRAILRIGLYELRHEPDTSVGTIIDEAVDLAKRYSTEESGRFVNGVLAALARQVRPEETVGTVEADG